MDSSIVNPDAFQCILKWIDQSVLGYPESHHFLENSTGEGIDKLMMNCFQAADYLNLDSSGFIKNIIMYSSIQLEIGNKEDVLKFVCNFSSHHLKEPQIWDFANTTCEKFKIDIFSKSDEWVRSHLGKS